MREAELLRTLLLELSRGDTRLFRNNVGTAWQGTPVWRTATELCLIRPRVVHFGLHDGSADLIGWRTITITPEMVGTRVAVFASIEAKAPRGSEEPKQKNWRIAVGSAGGLAATVRSVDDARLALDNPKWNANEE